MSQPQPVGRYNVLLIGEALGEQEAETGRPFSGRAGFLLDKLIKHAGLEREGFGIANAVWCRPPDNKLSGMPYEQQAVYECRERHLLPLVRSYAERRPVLVPLGAVALSSLLGRKDIIEARGYVWDHPLGLVYPTVHPSYIMRGNGNYGTVFIHDLQQAVEYARAGFSPAPCHYVLDPTPEEALRWADDYLAARQVDPTGVYLAFDIETPYEDELKEDGSLEDEDSTYVILRVGFAYRDHHALSIPWTGAFLPAISRILGTAGPKVVWNAGFDCPRIRANGVAINGPVHDGMVAWHVLESDLPKALRFVSSMLLPRQKPWKHLAASMPAFYNATDADVEQQLIHAIFRRLHAAGMWSVYDRHILQLSPILARLSDRGMPIDIARRTEYADLLATKLGEALTHLTDAVPLAARKVAHVYKNPPPPDKRAGLLSRPGTRTVSVCPGCGHVKPGKAHFKVFKKKANPCGGLQPVSQTITVDEYYRLADFRPSKEQLIRYCEMQKIKPFRRRSADGTYKVTFDENAIRQLMLKYPQDALFPRILLYREIDKIAGTYIGRPAEGAGRL